MRVRRFALWSGLALAGWLLLAGDYGFIRYHMLKNRQDELTLETRMLLVKAMDLEREIWRLQHDTLYIEKISRERLGYARPDERVYRITEH